MEADDDLVPDQAAQAEDDAPGPLPEVERSREEEGRLSVLNDDHLEKIKKRISLNKFSRRKHEYRKI